MVFNLTHCTRKLFCDIKKTVVELNHILYSNHGVPNNVSGLGANKKLFFKSSETDMIF
jgi:hypothetical protein